MDATRKFEFIRFPNQIFSFYSTFAKYRPTFSSMNQQQLSKRPRLVENAQDLQEDNYNLEVVKIIERPLSQFF